MNVKTIFSLVLLNIVTESNPNNPVNLNFDLEDKPKVKEIKGVYKRVKLTTYFTPIIEARYNIEGKFKHRINVYKKGKTFPIYIASNKGYYTEGFARISLPDKTFYIDHLWNWQPFVKNSKGKPLRKGDSASRYFKRGVKFVFKGDVSEIVDTGSGLSKKEPQIDYYTGEGNNTNKTYFTEVFFIDNN